MKHPKIGAENRAINVRGRKPLAIPFITICDVVTGHSTVEAAAQKLGCSRPYINKRLKEKGLKPGDIVGRDLGQ